VYKRASNKREDNMNGSIVWKINCATKHGIDTVLVRQDNEPTKKQLKKLDNKWRKEFDIEKDDERCYVELAGCIGIKNIPFLDEYIKSKEC
jgi:hypothetical protein